LSEMIAQIDDQLFVSGTLRQVRKIARLGGDTPVLHIGT